MTKRESIEDPNSCWNKADDDEEVFILLGRDPSAPAGVLGWIEDRVNSNRNSAFDRKIKDAFVCIGRLVVCAVNREAARQKPT